MARTFWIPLDEGGEVSGGVEGNDGWLIDREGTVYLPDDFITKAEGDPDILSGGADVFHPGIGQPHRSGSVPPRLVPGLDEPAVSADGFDVITRLLLGNRSPHAYIIDTGMVYFTVTPGALFPGGYTLTYPTGHAPGAVLFHMDTNSFDVVGLLPGAFMRDFWIHPTSGDLYHSFVANLMSTPPWSTWGGLARWRPDTQEWGPMGSGLAAAVIGNTFAQQFAALPDGRVIIVGNFGEAGGVECPNGQALYDPDADTFEEWGGPFDGQSPADVSTALSGCVVTVGEQYVYLGAGSWSSNGQREGVGGSTWPCVYRRHHDAPVGEPWELFATTWLSEFFVGDVSGGPTVTYMLAGKTAKGGPGHPFDLYDPRANREVVFIATNDSAYQMGDMTSGLWSEATSNQFRWGVLKATPQKLRGRKRDDEAARGSAGRSSQPTSLQANPTRGLGRNSYV